MQRPAVVLLTGYTRSGKDTVAAFLREHLAGKRDVHIVAHAAVLKDSLHAMHTALCPDEPYPRSHLDTAEKDTFCVAGKTLRRWMQCLSTECLRAHYGPDIFVNALCDRVAAVAAAAPADARPPLFVVTDCRFPNEVAVHRAREDVLRFVRVARASATPPDPAALHESERHVASLPADTILENNGTLDELRAAVARLAETVGV